MQRLVRRFISRVASFAYRRANGESGAAPLGLSVGADGVVLAGCSVEARSGRTEGRVSFGRNSVLSCRIVLERDVGTVSIGSDTFIGGSSLICAERIDVGNHVMVSWGCTIVDHDSHSLDWNERAEDVRRWREGLIAGGPALATEMKNWAVVPMAPVRICDKVWLGMNVTVVKGVTVGEGAVVAAGSIVTKDVPPWSLVAGNPARVIRDLARPEGV